MNRHKVKEVYDDCIVDIFGRKHYYKDNFMYKSISKRGSAFYYNEMGQIHRLDGPAIEYASGNKDYWIEDERYSYTEWLEKVESI